jgi:hypothetical protein
MDKLAARIWILANCTSSTTANSSPTNGSIYGLNILQYPSTHQTTTCSCNPQYGLQSSVVWHNPSIPSQYCTFHVVPAQHECNRDSLAPKVDPSTYVVSFLFFLHFIESEIDLASRQIKKWSFRLFDKNCRTTFELYYDLVRNNRNAVQFIKKQSLLLHFPIKWIYQSWNQKLLKNFQVIKGWVNFIDCFNC